MSDNFEFRIANCELGETSIRNSQFKIRNSSRRGFTLIEILMAFSILLLGIVGVYAIFAVGLVNHKRAVDNTTA
ncbi:MAG: prepilin-type N-terminal cleavage/methylation domain-containing protein, partial [Planctomycetes bacterium]|nr:prepilin-type N-terminal cleavage/methylation domain-containing protein [Planctomycetota bacterium]